MSKSFLYGEEPLTPGMAIALARGEKRGIISPITRQKIVASSELVAKIAAGNEAVYGINTGFGPLHDKRISAGNTRALQHNLLMSHSVGVGNSIPTKVARLMLITKMHALAQGYSGVALETIERILWHVESGYIPLVPEKGSVGASGDLAPLAHLFLPLIGLGKVEKDGKILEAAAMLRKENLSPIALGPKEGLGLINGTQFMLSFGVLGLYRFHELLNAADVIGALSLEGLMGSAQPFDARLHRLRPYLGAKLVAHRLSVLLKGSAILAAHQQCDRVQDPYSLRCMPQVHGASRNTWLHLKEVLEIELNSVTDNPILLGENEAISGGNFHGQPIALPLDYATLGAAELGNISDRRSFMMIEGRYGLPKLLINDAGLNSGLMIPQYTAAALVSENKSLCFPASADSIPTSLGQEDHVSMGSISSRKFHSVLDNLGYIYAIELLYAAQAIDFRRTLRSTPILEACHEFVRGIVPFVEEDRVFAEDIARLNDVVTDGTFNKVVTDFALKNDIDINGPYDETFRFS